MKRKLKIGFKRWPWQGGDFSAPLNPSGARFGGGWKYKLGIDIGSSCIVLNLVWGMVRFSLEEKDS